MQVGALEIKLFADIARISSDMNKANQVVDKAMGNIEKSVNRAKLAFGGLFAGVGLISIAKTIDEYKRFDSQLKLATKSASEYAEAYSNVVRISRISQSDIGAVGVLYARLTNNLRAFGTTQKEISTITEAVSLSLRVSNATVQETNSVMLQLSQSFGSGKINGQEFLAVSEGAPIIMRQLAKSLGVTYGELKNLSTEGKLTAEVLKTALSDPAYLEALREQVKVVGTISSALQVAKNSWTQYLGEADKGAGTSKLLSQGIILVADNINNLVTLGLGALIVKLGQMGAAAVTYLNVLKATAAQAARTAILEVEMANLTASAKAIEAQKSITFDRMKLASKVALLEVSRQEAAVALANVAGTAKETAALKILEAQTYKLVMAKGALAKASNASGIGMANNAAATTMLVSQWQQAEAVNNKLTKSIGLGTIAARGFGSAIAFLGGPIGVAIIAFGALGYAISKAFDKQELEKYGKAIDGIRERAAVSAEKYKAGIDINNEYGNEILNIKELQKARDGLFSKMKTDQESSSGFKMSLEERRKTALEYIQSIKDIKSAEADLGIKIEQDMINTKGKGGLEKLPDGIKLLSAQIKEQQEIMRIAKLQLDATSISQSDYNKIVSDATKVIEGLNGVTKANKDATAEKIRQLTIESNLIKNGVPEVVAKAAAEAKLNGATELQIIAIMNLTQKEFQREAGLKLINEQQKIARELAKQYTEDLQESAKALSGMVAAEEASIAKMQEEIDLLGKGSQHLADMEVARLRDAAAAYEQNAAMAIQIGLSKENIDYLQQQAKALNELADAKAKSEEVKSRLNSFKLHKEQADNRIKEAERAQEEIEKEAKRSSDEIGKSLTDALMRGFESGKGFAENFRKTLVDMFKTLVLRPIIQFLIDSSGLTKILGAISGAFSGAAGAAGGDTGLFGGLKNLYSFAKNGLEGANIAFEQSIQQFGTFITQFGSVGESIGGFISEFSGGISKVLPFAGAALSLLQGDFKGAIGSALGAALSFTPLGPVGGLIGSFLGGALGGLFGKKKAPRFDSNVIGKFDTETKGYQTFQGKTQYKPLGADAQLGSLGEQFSKTLDVLLSGLGVGSDITTTNRLLQKRKYSYGIFDANVNGQNVGTQVSTKGKRSAQESFNKLVEQVLGVVTVRAIQSSSLSAGIKKFFDGLTKKEDVAEAINALVGLKYGLLDLPPVFNAIRNAMDTTSYKTSIADLKRNFAAIGTYTSLFYTADEQFATFTKQITRQFNELDKSLPTSRAGYRALVDGISVTDKATSDLFNGLVSLAPAMDAYFKQLEEQKNLLNSFKTEDFFASLVAFKRYTGVASNFGTEFANNYTDNLPSFASGANILPSDMVAQVHAGERIVPAADNKAIIQALNGGELKELMSQLIVEVRAGNISLIQSAQKTAKVMQRIDDEGVMINETNNAGARTVLDTRVVV